MTATSTTPRQPVLGVCPIGKFVFSHEDAMRWKQRLQTALREWGVNYVDLDGVLEDGMIRDHAHAAPAVAHFRKYDVDGLFKPHCNFGTEGAAGVDHCGAVLEEMCRFVPGLQPVRLDRTHGA